MFSKTVDKFIAGALVATNILSVSASAGVDNDRREVQGKIASTEKSYNECDLVEYYDTYENACKRLEYLQKYKMAVSLVLFPKKYIKPTLNLNRHYQRNQKRND